MEVEVARSQDYHDRAKQVNELETTKAGVKGLVDSGIAEIPKFFIHSLEIPRPEPSCKIGNDIRLRVPVIDFQDYYGNRQKEIVESVRAAAETWGIFQMVNHGIPKASMEELLESFRRFHEQPIEEKMKWYNRDPVKGVMYYSNGYLVSSEIRADWRDTLTCLFQDKELDPETLPQICRSANEDFLKQHLCFYFYFVKTNKIKDLFGTCYTM